MGDVFDCRTKERKMEKMRTWLFWGIVLSIACCFTPQALFAQDQKIRLDSLVRNLSMGSQDAEGLVSESLWDEEGLFEEDELSEEDERGPWEFGLSLWNRLAVDTEHDDSFESDYCNHIRGVASLEYRYSDQWHAKAALQGDYFLYRYDDGWENDDDIRVHDAYVNFFRAGLQCQDRQSNRPMGKNGRFQSSGQHKPGRLSRRHRRPQGRSKDSGSRCQPSTL